MAETTISKLTSKFHTLLAPGPTTPAPTGCALAGVTPTIFVIAGFDGSVEKLQALVATTRRHADAATENRNRVIYVFLSGTRGNVEVMRLLLSFVEQGLHGCAPSDVRLVIGPDEMRLLQAVVEGERGARFEYLRRSSYMELVGDGDMDERGSGGAWIKHSGTQGGAIVGKLPHVGTSWADLYALRPLSLVEWKNEMNSRWSKMVENSAQLEEKDKIELSFWLALSRVEATAGEAEPAKGLNLRANRSIAVFAAAPTAPFSRVRQTFLEQDGKTFTDSKWIELNGWLVATWCGSTSRSFSELRRASQPVVDRTVSISRLQYLVNCTLATLVQFDAQTDLLGQPENVYTNFAKLRGVVGPCVRGGSGGGEPLRAIVWAFFPDDPTVDRVLMLLPEAYVRFMLEAHATLGLRRFEELELFDRIAVDDGAKIPLKLFDLTHAEQTDAVDELGPRLWRLAQKPGQASSSTTFDTLTSVVEDAIYGREVRWVFAPDIEKRDAKDMPTLVFA